MDLKRIKSAIAELSAAVDEMEGGHEPETMDDEADEGEAPKASTDALKMKLMKYKTA